MVFSFDFFFFALFIEVGDSANRSKLNSELFFMKSSAPCYINSKNDLEFIVLLCVAFQSELRYVSQYEQMCLWVLLLRS